MPLIYLKLTLMSLLWAGTFVAGRVLSTTLAPLPAASARFAVATLALLALLYWREGGLPRLSMRQALVTLSLGASGVFLYNIGFFGALSQMPASRSALFVAFSPILVALLAAALLGERLSPRGWLGVALALLGAITVISRGDPLGALSDIASVLGRGELYMLGAILSWAAYTLIGRNALRGLSPLAATTYAALWGFAMLALAQLLVSGPAGFQGFDLTALWLVLYMALGGTVIPFVWYYQGVAQIGASRAVVFTNFVPVFGVALGVLLLGETLLPSLLIGGALVLLGVSLTNR